MSSVSASSNDSETYSFEILNGSYICNKRSQIFGFDPVEQYFKTFNKKTKTYAPTEVCGGNCKKITEVSDDFEHIFVNVEVVPQTSEEKLEIKIEEKRWVVRVSVIKRGPDQLI